MTREVAGGRESACSRWPVLVACFLCHMTVVSLAYHAGVLHVALLDTFGQDVVTTAWLGAVYSCMPTLVGPLASFIITTFDLRTCLILSGLMAAVGASSCFFITRFAFMYPALILAGTGQGLSMTASYVAIGYNFPSQANILTGICVCGSGLGIFIHPPLLQVLVDRFALHGAMLVVGAISLHSVACGLAVPPFPYEKQRRLARLQRRTSLTLAASLTSGLEVVKDFRFLVFLFTGLGFSSGLACYYLYLPDFLLHSNYDAMTASFVLSATGMGSIPSRLLTGGATNDANIDATTFFFGIHAMAAVATLLVPFTAGSLVAQMVLAVVFGVYTGAAWASYSPLLLELLGVRRVAGGVGLYLFTMGVGYVAAPPLAGLLYTRSNNFHHVFYFTAAMFALASAACLLSMLVKKRDVTQPLSVRAKAMTTLEFMVESDVTTDLRQQRDSLLLPRTDQDQDLTVVAEVTRVREKDGLSRSNSVQESLLKSVNSCDSRDVCIDEDSVPRCSGTRESCANERLPVSTEDHKSLVQDILSTSTGDQDSLVQNSFSSSTGDHESQDSLPTSIGDHESQDSLCTSTSDHNSLVSDSLHTVTAIH